MTKLALLIGVSEYGSDLSPLPAAIRDIDAIQEVLLNSEIGGFSEANVTSLKNPNRQLVEESIYTLFSDRQKDDLLLLFFSGHGIKDDSGTLYLSTQDTRKTPQGELITPTAVSASYIHTRMSRSRSRRQVVILDSCFSGAFAEGLSAKDDGSLNIRQQLGGEGRAILTSSSSTQYSFEQTEEELSLYTRFLIEGIKTGEADSDEDDVISVDELHNYARCKVQEVKPEINPEIYTVREGFRIHLLKVAQGDPYQKYRREVTRHGKRGGLTIVSRSILDEWIVKLELLPEEAKAIEAEILDSYREEFQSRILRYETVVRNILDKEGKIDAYARQELETFQRVLELRNEDTVPLEERVSREWITHRQNLEEYGKIFLRLSQQEYPHSDAAQSKLQQEQKMLGLSNEDIVAIETQLVKEVETYRHKLDQYERAFVEATQTEFPLSRSKINELKHYRKSLHLSDVDVSEVESKVTTRIEIYRQKLLQYEGAFSSATQRKYMPNQSLREQLDRIIQDLGISIADVKSVEIPIIRQIQNYQSNLKKYKREFSDAIAKELSLSSSTTYKLRQRQQSLSLSSTDVNSVESEVRREFEERRRRIQQYEQAFIASIQYDFPVSKTSRKELDRLKSVLELNNEEVELIESRVASKTSLDQNIQTELNVADTPHELPRVSESADAPNISNSYTQSFNDHSVQRAQSSSEDFVAAATPKPSPSSNFPAPSERLPSQKALWWAAVALGSASIVITGTGIHLSSSTGVELSSSGPKALIDEVWQLVDDEYVDTSFNGQDWDSIRAEYLGRIYTDEEEAYSAIREMLDSLEDPYTRFMNPQEFSNIQIDTSSELTGVGIQISQNEETDKILVVAPIQDTPAYEAGLLSGDVIVSVDGKSTEGMELSDVINLIRGPVNSNVTLSVTRDGEAMDFKLTRARVEIHPVRYSVEASPEGTVGYIRLTQFSSNAADEMREAIKELEERDVTGYVLDLRSNPGGLFSSSIEIADMWIDQGTIVSTVDRNSVRDEETADNEILTERPLVVLTDEGSASGSEILLGALQDNDRAVLVGTQTFGKGKVQSVRELSDGSGVSVTIANYLTPSGRNIDKLGIEPDYVVELTDEQRDALVEDRNRVGTMEDPQYAKAIEVLMDSIHGTRP